MKMTFQNILILFLSISVILLGLLQFNRNESIAYVDSSKLINGYAGMTVARKQYKEKAIIWQANTDTLLKEIQIEIMKFEKDSRGMTSKERELSKKLIEAKQKQLNDYQRAKQDKSAQEDSALTKRVIDEINDYIKDYGKLHNYKIIFAATDYGNIAYAQDGLDITDEILTGLNNKFSGK
jgi:outer membrane protein